MYISGKYYCINAKKMYTYSEKSMIMFVITLFVAFKICFKQLSSESAYERNLKMDKKIIYVKLIKGCDPIDHFEQSYQRGNDNKQNYYYNLNQGSEIEDINDNSSHYIIGLIHSNKKIELAYLGLCNKHINNKGVSLVLDIKVKMENCTSIENIQKLSELDLDSDFGDSSYVLVEDSELIAKQIDFIIKKPLECSVLQRTYSCLDTEKDLHPLAQKNQYCRRQYNLRDSMKNRGEFQRDYERIVHSKSFRRMVDKAQIFSASKGDYYRTRMTHSQAVAQIARGIAEGLHLNLYLTEAIALAHDIGHTPFGHQGERTLDDILRNKIEIIRNPELFENDYFGGFKHNYQSIRVATILEDEYAEVNGMDLSFQTLEGILKHTKLDKKYTLGEFIHGNKIEEELHLKQEFCSTLEGQAVNIADEIAQRGHDLDDAFSSGVMTYDELMTFLSVKKYSKLKEIVNNAGSGITDAVGNGRRLVDESELKNCRTVSAIISYFINDVIDTSQKAIQQYRIKDFEDAGHIVKEKLVSFSDEALKSCWYLETIITNKVINRDEISLFDSNASTIISSLFKAYYNNPRLLHKGTQRRIYIETRQYCENVIDFEFGNHKIIKEELKLITHADLSMLSEEMSKEYKIKRRILVRNICDFISGMTDTYALNEFNRIMKQL